MTLTCILARLDFEWDCEGLLFLSILHDDLNGGVNVPFQPIHRRPDMLLDIKKLVDAHLGPKAIAVNDNRRRLTRSAKIYQSVEAHTFGFAVTNTSAHALSSGILLIR